MKISEQVLKMKSVLLSFTLLAFYLAGIPAQSFANKSEILAVFENVDRARQMECKTTPQGADVILSPLNVYDNTHKFIWFGPFGSVEEVSPQVYMPEGRHRVTYYVDNGSTFIAKESYDVVVRSCFKMKKPQNGEEIQLTWKSDINVERYDIFRAEQTSPTVFTKIGEEFPVENKKKLKFIDANVEKDSSYLYAVGKLINESFLFTKDVAGHTSVESDLKQSNYPPLIYSQPIGVATAGVLYTYKVKAIDPDGKRTKISLLNAPKGMTIGKRGRIYWVPKGIGKFEVTVEALGSNIEDSTQQIFEIEVGDYEVPLSVSLNVDPIAVPFGQDISLTWDSIYADKVVIDNNIGTVSPSGMIEIDAEQSTTYTISASAFGETVTDSATIIVGPAVFIEATPNPIFIGSGSKLTWQSYNVDTVIIDQGIGSVGLNSPEGGLDIFPTETTSYSISATGPSGSATSSVTVEVQPLPEFLVQIESPLNGATLKTSPIIVTGHVLAESTVLVNSVPATVAGDKFTAVLKMDNPIGATGPITIRVDAYDIYGRYKNHTVDVVFDPDFIFTIDNPINGSIIKSSTVKISGHVSAGSTVSVFGTPAVVTGETYTAELELGGPPGPFSIIVEAIDFYGRYKTKNVDIVFDPDFELVIDSPVRGSVVKTTPMTVTGYVTPGSIVNINGVPAVVTGDIFTAEVEINSLGMSHFLVDATDIYGRTKSEFTDVIFEPDFDLSIDSPLLGSVVKTSPVTVTGHVTPGSTVNVNGIPALVTNDSFAAEVEVSDWLGSYPISVSATDIYGRTKSESTYVVFEPDFELSIDSPVPGSVVKSSPVTVTGHVTPGSTVNVNGIPALVTNDSFTAEIEMPDWLGSYLIHVNATDIYGRTKSEVIEVVFEPDFELSIDSPVSGTVVKSSPLTVTGHVTPGSTVNVNGFPAIITNDRFTAEVEMPGWLGSYPISVDATDIYGRTKLEGTDVVFEPDFELSIDSPVSGTIVKTSPVIVTGHVTPGSTVNVDGFPAVVTDDIFTAEVELPSPGQHPIFIDATDIYSRTKSEITDVVFEPDFEFSIDSPVSGTIVKTSPVIVTGHVSLGSTVNVNGFPAVVTDDIFTAEVELPFPGPHPISIDATDIYGRYKSDYIEVIYEP